MTYKEAREFIDQSKQYGSKLGLETVSELLNRLGNPQDQLKVIHVAGTNGKGSTAAMISSILASEGYLVGRYISPAVFSYRERIQISKASVSSSTKATVDIEVSNDTGDHRFSERTKADNISRNTGEYKASNNTANCNSDEYTEIITDYITEEGVCDTIKVIKSVCESMVRDGLHHPTSFEIETAMALLYLFWEKVDFAIVEVGLGGRLDATNVFRKPICCVITSISMDHMQYLGDTLELITREKAGIIKPGSPVITGNKAPDIRKVIAQTCIEMGAELTIAEEEAKDIIYSPEGTTFLYQGEKYILRLLGKYQINNAILAILTANVMQKLGYAISNQSLKNGLYQARWCGRFEMLTRAPYFIIDGAHNEDAAIKLKESLELYFSDRRKIFILGVLADKDYRSILRITAPLAGTIITLTPDNSRALASSQLAKVAKEYSQSNVFDAGTVTRAVEYAYEIAGKEDVIIAFGSLSYLGELTEYITQHPGLED